MTQEDKDIIRGYRIIQEVNTRLPVSADSFSLANIVNNVNLVLDQINLTGKHAAKRPDDAQLALSLTKRDGIIDSYGELPNHKEQVSRLAIAWWEESFQKSDGLKHVRILADCIQLLIKFPAVPIIIPFGIEPYFMVFPTKHPYHCLKCRDRLEIGKGLWQDSPEPVGGHFLCPSCKYEHDNGFRPGIRQRKVRHT